MPRYADSSFLVSTYLPDAHSADAHYYFHHEGGSVMLSPLNALEVTNAFELALFQKLLPRPNVKLARDLFAGDLKRGRLMRVDIDWRCSVRFALGFSRQHSRKFGTRSLDVLH